MLIKLFFHIGDFIILLLLLWIFLLAPLVLNPWGGAVVEIIDEC